MRAHPPAIRCTAGFGLSRFDREGVEREVEVEVVGGGRG